MSSSSSNTGPLGTVTGVGASGAGACGGAGGGLSAGDVAWFTELFAADASQASAREASESSAPGGYASRQLG